MFIFDIYFWIPLTIVHPYVDDEIKNERNYSCYIYHSLNVLLFYDYLNGKITDDKKSKYCISLYVFMFFLKKNYVRYGHIDYLFLNAGIMPVSKVDWHNSSIEE